MHKETKATALSPALKQKVFRRDGGRCVLCGRPGEPVAHVVRRSQGGRGVERNLVTLCGRCHRAFDEGAGLEQLGQGVTRADLYQFLTDYLKGFYPEWTRESVTYHKWEDLC